MEEARRHILFVVMRWLHIVCTTLLVGGTLFFEFVVPLAIEDLKREQQMHVFGKARWVFRRVIWVCAILLLLSGAVSVVRLWGAYDLPRYGAAVPWTVAHMAIGIVALGIALVLTNRRRPPDHAIFWLRLNLALLLLGIFTATVVRHIGLTVREQEAKIGRDAARGFGRPVPPPAGADQWEAEGSGAGTATHPTTTRPTTTHPATKPANPSPPP